MDYKEKYNQFIERIYPNPIMDMGYDFYIGEYLSDVELFTGEDLTDYINVTADVYSNNYLINSYDLSGGTMSINNQTITLNIITTNFNIGENMVIIKLYIDTDNYDEIVIRLGKSYKD